MFFALFPHFFESFLHLLRRVDVLSSKFYGPLLQRHAGLGTNKKTGCDCDRRDFRMTVPLKAGLKSRRMVFHWASDEAGVWSTKTMCQTKMASFHRFQFRPKEEALLPERQMLIVFK